MACWPLFSSRDGLSGLREKKGRAGIAGTGLQSLNRAMHALHYACVSVPSVHLLFFSLLSFYFKSRLNCPAVRLLSHLFLASWWGASSAGKIGSRDSIDYTTRLKREDDTPSGQRSDPNLSQRYRGGLSPMRNE
jgi:hypothetical protein